MGNNGNGSFGLVSNGYMVRIADRHGYLELLNAFQDENRDMGFVEALRLIGDNSSTANTFTSVVDAWFIGAVKSNAPNISFKTKKRTIKAI